MNIPLAKPKNGSYFVTITLDPKLYKYTSLTQFEMTACEVHNIIDHASLDYGCVAELTDDANVHYHAWIDFRSYSHRIQFINRIKKCRILGFIKINKEPIENVVRVYDYMIKQYKITKQYINSCKDIIMKPFGLKTPQPNINEIHVNADLTNYFPAKPT
jgi:hypothetical protein